MAVGVSEVTQKNTQLHPSEELRRPDQHGQLPHIILTTSPDTPLRDLTIDDIVQINWHAVLTAIRDAIVRVKHEGDLSSATLRETIQLIALALKKLEAEDAYYRRLLVDHPRIGLIAWFIALWPGIYGQRVRKVLEARRRAQRKIVELEEVRDNLFEGRIELASEVDRRLDGVLLRENDEYLEMHRSLPQNAGIRAEAKVILDEFRHLDKLEQYVSSNEISATGRRMMKQIREKMPAYIEFAAEQSGREIENQDRGRAEVCLRRLIAELDAKAEPIERAMEAMRDARKQELYGLAVL